MQDVYLLLVITIAIGIGIAVFTPFAMLFVALIKWLRMYDSRKTLIRDRVISISYIILSSILITFTIIKLVAYIQ